MKRVRVLAAVPTLGPGGAERVLSLLADGWCARGAEVRIITWGEEVNIAFAPGAGVEVATLNLLRPSRSRMDGLRSNLARLHALSEEIVRWRPTVVLGMTTHTSVIASFAAQRHGLPVIVAERNYPPHHDVGLAWELLRRRSHRRATHVVMQTERAAQWARPRFGSRHVSVVPNPVSPAFLEPVNRGPRSRTIVVLGRLIRGKRPEVALGAFVRLAARYPDWNLAFVGDGPLRLAMQTEVRARGLSDRVEFHGVIRDVPELLRHAGAVLFTSESEGFPNALLEAMACGAAIVSSDCDAGPAEMLGDGNGLIVPVGDANRTAAALERLLADPELRRSLGARARAAAEHYSLDVVLDRWNPMIMPEST